MKAVTKLMLGGAAVAALLSAAPAAAQYPYGGYGGYGGYGYGYSSGGNVIGQILNSILGGRTYGANDRQAISVCVAATEARLNGYQGGYGYNSYGYQGYNSYNGYGGYGAYGNAGGRVTRITGLERRTNGGLKIYGLATTGYNGGYNQGYGYNGYDNPYGYNQAYGAQLRFNCKVDYAGRVTDVDIDRRY